MCQSGEGTEAAFREPEGQKGAQRGSPLREEGGGRKLEAEAGPDPAGSSRPCEDWAFLQGPGDALGSFRQGSDF